MFIILPNLMFSMVWVIIYYGVHKLRQPVTSLLGILIIQMAMCFDCFMKDDHHYFASMSILWCAIIGLVSLLMFNIVDLQVACYLFATAFWQCIRIIMEN